MFGACGAHDIFVSSCEIIGGYAKTPVGERGITPGSNGRRPVHGCSNRTSVACVAILRTTDGNHAKRPFGPVASGGDSAGSRPCRHTQRIAPLLKRGRRSLPLPMSLGGVALATCEHRPSSGDEKRSANRLRTRCERHITDMVTNVKIVDLTSASERARRATSLTMQIVHHCATTLDRQSSCFFRSQDALQR